MKVILGIDSLLKKTSTSKMRILHTMLSVGDLDKSIDFYVNRLGINLLRKKDYPHGKFTLAFVGYGSEKENKLKVINNIYFQELFLLLLIESQYKIKNALRSALVI